MPHQGERPASALAHGPAKPSDIERVRREMARAQAQRATPEPRVERALGEMAAACQTIHKDLNEIKRAIATEGPATKAGPRARERSA
jgi:hypothetical protein